MKTAITLAAVVLTAATAYAMRPLPDSIPMGNVIDMRETTDQHLATDVDPNLGISIISGIGLVPWEFARFRFRCITPPLGCGD
jgi:hypothetical protein